MKSQSPRPLPWTQTSLCWYCGNSPSEAAVSLLSQPALNSLSILTRRTGNRHWSDILLGLYFEPSWAFHPGIDMAGRLPRWAITRSSARSKWPFFTSDFTTLKFECYPNESVFRRHER